VIPIFIAPIRYLRSSFAALACEGPGCEMYLHIVPTACAISGLVQLTRYRRVPTTMRWGNSSLGKGGESGGCTSSLIPGSSGIDLGFQSNNPISSGSPLARVPCVNFVDALSMTTSIPSGFVSGPRFVIANIEDNCLINASFSVPRLTVRKRSST
jgi:hypothetical protein